MDYRTECPEVIRDFLTYHETIKGHSRATVDEYFLDLRTFFRFLKQLRGLAPDNADFERISISDVDIALIRSVALSDVYEFLTYLARDRTSVQSAGNAGLKSASRARKISTLRSFYKYLTVKAHILEENPLQDLDSPKIAKTLPRFLTLEESRRLLLAVTGKNKARDYCILCIFLNCGLRISEIVGLNLGDVRSDHLRVMGKGSKERIVYLNDSTAEAINGYLLVRRGIETKDRNALFLSNQRSRMVRGSVHHMVKTTLLKAGLDSSKYSAHKLRHTAATLMLKNGVDVRTLQELLGHEHLNTTQIYTHVDNSDLHMAADANPLASFSPDKPE